MTCGTKKKVINAATMAIAGMEMKLLDGAEIKEDSHGRGRIA